ncbi:hypothetical protein LCGC14_1195240 [marine sediment metagenome]|uniref:Uncharacterized protein n=1 Tax=marine sediment metagenome TaxID=412755 RepID=A0A0F9LIL5_9ZZZZ
MVLLMKHYNINLCENATINHGKFQSETLYTEEVIFSFSRN